MINHTIPLLIAGLVSLVLVLIGWGWWRVRSHETGDALMASRHDILPWLLALAAFALGAFLTYILVGFSS